MWCDQGVSIYAIYMHVWEAVAHAVGDWERRQPKLLILCTNLGDNQSPQSIAGGWLSSYDAVYRNIVIPLEYDHTYLLVVMQ